MKPVNKTNRCETGQSFSSEEIRELRDAYQIPISDRYPELSRALIEIKDNIVDSFTKKDFSSLPPAKQKRMEEYQKILSGSNLRILLSESEVCDARHFLDKGIIVVNIGLFKGALEGGLDSISFFIGHEISHLLYEKSSLLSENEKRGKLSNHDKEYQCDKDAVTLMDIAGYNPSVAPLFPVKKQEQITDHFYKYDLGIQSSHPDLEARRVRLSEIVENGIWENYQEGFIHEVTKDEKAELNREAQPSEQLKNARNEFERKFYKDLEKNLAEPIERADKLTNDECVEFGIKIPEIFRERFEAYEKGLTPEYKERSILLFRNAMGKAISDFRFSFESEKDCSLGELLLEMETRLPCLSEINSSCMYDPFNDCMRQAFGRYTEVIETFFSEHDTKRALIKEREIPDEQVVDFIRVGLRKLGPKMFASSIKMDINRLGDILEKVGSERLVIQLMNKDNIPSLRENPYCCEILDSTLKLRAVDPQYVSISVLPDEQKKKLLFMPECHKEIKEKIIDEYVMQQLRDKTIQPLELLQVFDVIRKTNSGKRICLPEQFVDKVHEYTEKEPDEVKKFWDEQLISIGLFPVEVNSPKELAKLLENVPSGVLGDDRIETVHLAFAKVEPLADDDSASNSEMAELTEKEGYTLTRFLKKVGFDTLEKEGFFNNLENVSRYWIDGSSASVGRMFFDISEDPYKEPIGSEIEFRDFIFARFLKQEEYEDLHFEKKEDAITWVKKYLPRRCEFRDLVLTNIFERNNFENELKDKDAKDFFVKFLSLYDTSGFRKEFIADKIYQAFRDDTQSLDDKLSFISTCFSHPTLTKDKVIDEMITNHLENSEDGVELKELHKVFYYYSACDRRSERMGSIVDATLGSCAHNCSTEEKLAIAKWLFLGGTKPKTIFMSEAMVVHAKLDCLPSLMASSEIRHKALEMLFFGKNGLGVEGNESYFDSFIGSAFDKYFPSSTGSGPKDKLSSFGRELVKNTLHTATPYEREKLLSRMFDLAQDESSKDIEAFLPNWVAGHSATAVKFLQIVASRPEVKEYYPELYGKCKEAMSNAERMSFHDLIVSLSTNPELRNGNYTISEIIGSASIKVVLNGKSKEGDDVVIKVLRHNAGKYVEAGAETLKKNIQLSTEAIQRNFGVERMPYGVVDRASQATKDETDFELELRNSAILADAIKGLSTEEYTVTTPEILFQDKNLIIETKGSGETLEKYLESYPEESDEIARYTQAIFLNLLNKGVVLSDMHQGNILVDKDGEGKFKFTLIDTGSLYKLSDEELRGYKKVLAGVVVSVLEDNGGVEKLLQRALSSNKAFGWIIEKKLSSMNIGGVLSSEKLLDGAIRELVGDKIYEANSLKIKECLQKIQKAESPVTKPLSLIGLFDDLVDEDGSPYAIPNSTYWSIIGTTKVFGLDRYQKENNPIYIETFGPIVKEELFSSGKVGLFGSLMGGLLAKD